MQNSYAALPRDGVEPRRSQPTADLGPRTAQGHHQDVRDGHQEARHAVETTIPGLGNPARAPGSRGGRRRTPCRSGPGADAPSTTSCSRSDPLIGEPQHSSRRDRAVPSFAWAQSAVVLDSTPHPIYVAMLVLELALPPLMVVVAKRVAKPANV